MQPSTEPASAAPIDLSQELELVASGFEFTEGPVWVPADGSLIFSDLPGDKRRRWHPEHGVTVERDPSNKGNGMTTANDGALVVCEHSTSSVVRESPEGGRTTIASHWQGRQLNSPNDVIVARDGSVLFTDPTYGRLPYFGVEREPELDFQGVFRVSPTGELHLLVADFAQPNGLCLSPDERLLYVDDTERAHIRVFEVGSGWCLSNDRVFAAGISARPELDDGHVDGMKVDEHGNVYVTAPEGVRIYSSGGERIGTIDVPQKAANLNWGDADWQSLYITASTSIYRKRLNVAGNRLPYMT